MRKLLLLCSALIATSAAAQLPGLGRRAPQPALPVQSPADLLRADFAAQAGGTTVYFAPGMAILSPQGKGVLAGQANWLRLHADVPVRIEGYGDGNDTRDHALAMGARRANEVRDYLLLLGVPSGQVTAMSWGKERPGPGRSVTTIVQ
jgi:peptidoglycan-associated lipoprotein